MRRWFQAGFLSLSCAITCSWASLQAATDFSAADALFARRAEGSATAFAAYKAYQSMLKGASLDDQIYIISQMGRLDIYRSVMLKGVPVADQREILKQCELNTETIASTKRQEYYYFKSACLAHRARLATTLTERGALGLKLKSLSDAALNSTRNERGQLVGGFEAGGILRVTAGLYGNVKARVLPGMFQPKLAAEYAEIAIQTPAQKIRPFPERLGGADFYENYFYYAFATAGRALDSSATEARGFAEKALDEVRRNIDEIQERISDNSLPAGREPESLYYMEKFQGLRGLLERCLAKPEWKACIDEGMQRE